MANYRLCVSGSNDLLTVVLVGEGYSSMTSQWPSTVVEKVACCVMFCLDLDAIDLLAVKSTNTHTQVIKFESHGVVNCSYLVSKYRVFFLLVCTCKQAHASLLVSMSEYDAIGVD